MTLKHTENRCWCITVDGDDEFLDGLHLETEVAALEALSQAPVGQKTTTELLEVPCLFLICDHCEEEAEDDTRGLHFLSVREAMMWAQQNGWTTDGIRFWCDACSGYSEPPKRIPVLPGQITLGTSE